MLQNMFVGRPPGNYDRLLDFSRAVTGNLFFVPAASFLEDVSDEQAADAVAPDTNADAERDEESGASSDSASRAPTDNEGEQAAPSTNDGSLGIGSLKGDIGHE